MSRQSDYITEVRTCTRQFWRSWEALMEAQREWNALDYGNTLVNGVGENSGITGAQVGAVVFDTANAIKTVMEAGNATNVAKLL